MNSMISPTISLDDDGVRFGFLRVPHSINDSAYGHIPIPIAVAKQGTGPTVLLTAGVHGDEYEGPLALYSLMRHLQPEFRSGRLIIVPSLNHPAFSAGSRVSPIDAINLNRSFPGLRDGSVTQVIAHYVSTELLTRADYAFDFHSGGSSLQYMPLLFAPRWSDCEKSSEISRLVEAFAPPLVCYFDSLRAIDGEDRVFGNIADKNNSHFLTGEFGGGASVNLDGLTILRQGIGRVLAHLGILGNAAAPTSGPQKIRTVVVDSPGLSVFSPVNGIFEPAFRLEDEILPGAPAGYIYDPSKPWSPPLEVNFEEGGMAVCIRTFSKVKPGDCLGHLARDL